MMGDMHLRKYLSTPHALAIPEIRRRMNELGGDVRHDAQIRQWAAGTRRPDAANCMLLELATDRKVSRQAMRPTDYWLTWTDLPAPKRKARKQAEVA